MASEEPKHQFNIEQLSKDDSVIANYVAPYRKLRLASLQIDPEAFASTYERESQFTDDIWDGRLKNPKAEHIVAYVAPTATDNSPNLHAMHLEDWVAMVVLFGPINPDEGALNANKSPWSAAVSEGGDESAAVNVVSRYHLNAVFTMPTARRHGLGYKLIQSALELAEEKERKRNTSAIHFSVLVNEVNEAAKALYEKSGFVVTKKEKLAERDMIALTTERVRAIARG